MVLIMALMKLSLAISKKPNNDMGPQSRGPIFQTKDWKMKNDVRLEFARRVQNKTIIIDWIFSVCFLIAVAIMIVAFFHMKDVGFPW